MPARERPRSSASVGGALRSSGSGGPPRPMQTTLSQNSATFAKVCVTQKILKAPLGQSAKEVANSAMGWRVSRPGVDKLGVVLPGYIK